MSLQFQSCIDAYSRTAAGLWNDWRTKNQMNRLQTALNAIRRATPFLPAVQYDSYSTPDWGDYGVHYPGLWRIEINRYHPAHANITLEDFIEWVMTPFHETRHAEQTYRIAQGVLAGELVPPGQNLQRIIQAALAGRPPREVAQALESHNPLEVVSADVRKRIVREWLQVPAVVINHADVHRAYFANFLASNVPSWLAYRRDGLRSAVIDWMKASYDGYLGEIDRRAQNQEAGWDRMYMTLPEEKDAYGIEGAVKEKILEFLGKDLDTDANDTPP